MTEYKITNYELTDIITNQKTWSKETFGEGPRTEGVLRHIESEIAEIRAEQVGTSAHLEEWVDIIILAIDGAWRSGDWTPEEICAMLEAKQLKNRHRQWKRTAPDEPSFHVK